MLSSSSSTEYSSRTAISDSESDGFLTGAARSRARLLAASTLGPSGCAVRYPVEPIGQEFALADRAGLACQHEECRLECILGRSAIVEYSPAHVHHHGAVPCEQHLEGRFIAPNRKSLKQLSVTVRTGEVLRAERSAMLKYSAYRAIRHDSRFGEGTTSINTASDGRNLVKYLRKGANNVKAIPPFNRARRLTGSVLRTTFDGRSSRGQSTLLTCRGHGTRLHRENAISGPVTCGS